MSLTPSPSLEDGHLSPPGWSLRTVKRTSSGAPGATTDPSGTEVATKRASIFFLKGFASAKPPSFSSCSCCCFCIIANLAHLPPPLQDASLCLSHGGISRSSEHWKISRQRRRRLRRSGSGTGLSAARTGFGRNGAPATRSAKVATIASWRCGCVASSADINSSGSSVGRSVGGTGCSASVCCCCCCCCSGGAKLPWRWRRIIHGKPLRWLCGWRCCGPWKWCPAPKKPRQPFFLVFSSGLPAGAGGDTKSPNTRRMDGRSLPASLVPIEWSTLRTDSGSIARDTSSGFSASAASTAVVSSGVMPSRVAKKAIASDSDIGTARSEAVATGAIFSLPFSFFSLMATDTRRKVGSFEASFATSISSPHESVTRSSSTSKYLSTSLSRGRLYKQDALPSSSSNLAASDSAINLRRRMSDSKVIFT
mmetsp:Transcript_760/g.2741  ORF Transcript_760/g.2741 Transcript_760/m.2741 type:complete len:422 (+) Transcript_760:552-1817(+)